MVMFFAKCASYRRRYSLARGSASMQPGTNWGRGGGVGRAACGRFFGDFNKFWARIEEGKLQLGAGEMSLLASSMKVTVNL